MFEGFSERGQKVLNAVIHNYILTAVPVGSKVIAEKYGLKLSSASVRNIMASLEEMGYLAQPHTSAGRIPTDKGFRFYVDSLIKLRDLKRIEKNEIKQLYYDCLTGTKDIMEETSKILSLLSHYMGVVLAPKFPSKIIKQIEFISLSPKQVLVILISASGMIYNKVVDLDEKLYQKDLDRMSNYLNEIASNMTLTQIKERLVEEMRKEKTLYDKLLSKAIEIGQAAMQEVGDRENIYIEGKVNILEQPEFSSDIEMMKNLFRAFEEKSILVKILDKSLKTEGVEIFIGSESEFSEVRDYSIITAPYMMQGSAIGTLGVIGPKRMNYAKVIPIVDYTAELVGKFLQVQCERS